MLCGRRKGEGRKACSRPAGLAPGKVVPRRSGAPLSPGPGPSRRGWQPGTWVRSPLLQQSPCPGGRSHTHELSPGPVLHAGAVGVGTCPDHMVCGWRDGPLSSHTHKRTQSCSERKWLWMLGRQGTSLPGFAASPSLLMF